MTTYFEIVVCMVVINENQFGCDDDDISENQCNDKNLLVLTMVFVRAHKYVDNNDNYGSDIGPSCTNVNDNVNETNDDL